MPVDWNNENAIEFINLYKEECIIWNPNHPLHKDRIEVMNAWTRIRNAFSVNVTVVDLKKKKESLMTAYRFHTNKKKENPAYRISWFAYQLMNSFLSTRYGTDEDDDDNNDQQETEQYIIIQNPTNEQEEETKASLRPRKIIKTLERKHSANYAKKQTNDDITNLKRTMVMNSEPDECELYAQLLARKLRRLNEQQRDIAMHEIDNIMFRARMSDSKMGPKSQFLAGDEQVQIYSHINPTSYEEQIHQHE